MCHMVSVTILGTERGLELLAEQSLISHNKIGYRYGIHPRATVFEVEWLEGELMPIIRYPPGFLFEQYVEDWLLSNYPTRNRLIECARLVAKSPIPEYIAERVFQERASVYGRDFDAITRSEHERMWAMEAQLSQTAPVVTAAEIEQPIPVDVGRNSLSEELFGKVEVVG